MYLSKKLKLDNFMGAGWGVCLSQNIRVSDF